MKQLLVRTIYDALLDLAYLLHDPNTLAEKLQLLAKEVDKDALQEQSHYLSLGLIQQTDIVSQLLQTQSKPEKQELKSKNWMDIRGEEKLKALGDYGKSLESFGFSIRHLGNAQAHSRPVALIDFLQVGSDRPRVTFRTRQIPSFYSASMVRFESTICLLLACNMLIDKLGIATRLSGTLIRIFNQLACGLKILQPNERSIARDAGGSS